MGRFLSGLDGLAASGSTIAWFTRVDHATCDRNTDSTRRRRTSAAPARPAGSSSPHLVAGAVSAPSISLPFVRRGGGSWCCGRPHGRALSSRTTRADSRSVGAASCTAGGCGGGFVIPRPSGVPGLAGGRSHAACASCSASPSSRVPPASASDTGCTVPAAVPAAATVPAVSGAVLLVPSSYAAARGAAASSATSCAEYAGATWSG
jgi:hypothetical protein